MPLLAKSVQVGQQFAGEPKYLAIQRLWTFSGGPFTQEGWPRKNLHTDLEAARNVGLPTVAASATQFQGFLVQLLVDLFGAQWLTNGTMDIKFVNIAKDGDTITPKVTVQSTEATNKGIRVIMEAWCENQDGEKVLVGTVTGMLPEA